MRRMPALVLLPLLALGAAAQSSSTQPSTATAAPAKPAAADPVATSDAAQLAALAPKARAEDVSSPEALVNATYSVISGPPGARDWDRWRSLFLPAARLTAAGLRKDGAHVISELSPEGYVTKDGPYFATHGFFEKAIRTRVDTFGSLAVAFSSYESRETLTAAPFARGINSFQMMSDGKRWWIVSIAWDDERSGQKLPADMLK